MYKEDGLLKAENVDEVDPERDLSSLDACVRRARKEWRRICCWHDTKEGPRAPSSEAGALAPQLSVVLVAWIVFTGGGSFFVLVC